MKITRELWHDPVRSMRSIWCCPLCHGEFVDADPTPDGLEQWRCNECSREYQLFDGVPDLRIPGESWIDYEDDRRLARRFIDETKALSLPDTLEWVFRSRNKTFDDREIQVRVRQVIKSVDHLQQQIEEWLSPCLDAKQLALDVGCGPGQLAAAAARRGYVVAGIDVRLLWVLAAKRLITEYGGIPIVAAGLAEALPLPESSVASVISLDVIEHVASVRPYLKELDRVTMPGGKVALSTPNRFSLAAEPHVGVWGVGWVPRRWQKAYVRARKGIPYEYTCLLGVAETRQLLKTNTAFVPHIFVPQVAEHEIERFPEYRKVLARIYNKLAPMPLFRLPLLAVGPFFRVIGVKKRPRTVSAWNNASRETARSGA